MHDKVLIVDDDPNVLKAYERRLRKHFDVETALCSEEGVTAVNFLGPFAVIVSDMQMPRENGVRFLQRILELAPDSVRIMLTGNADQGTAAEAINQSRVFRFLNKPCEAEELIEAIQSGIEEHRQRCLQKQMLSETLVGAIDMMSKVMSITNPVAFGRATQLKAVVSQLAKELKTPDAWEFESAALLSQVGWITVPDAVVKKHNAGVTLSKSEQQILDSRFTMAADLIEEVPRLERVAAMVRRCNDPPERSDDDQPLSAEATGSELLRLASRYVELTDDSDLNPTIALDAIESSDEWFEVSCLDALRAMIARTQERELVTLDIDALEDGMVLAEDVCTTDDAVLLTRGHEVTPTIRQRLTNYCKTHSIKQPVRALALRAEAMAASG